LEWASGILSVLALLLLLALLGAILWLVLVIRRSIERTTRGLEQLTRDVQPIIEDTRAMVADTRGMVTRVRADVERVSGAAGAVGDHVRAAADHTADQLKELDGVLDQMRDEVVATGDAAIRALRLVRWMLRSVVGGGRPRRSTRRRRDRVPAEPSSPHAPER
jgi:CHASE3 domain sensor protein